mmetsp:Transcript_9745/g.21862  ORF Transcript_9745/g.21862 Transcript_9745/m.21862 type:complete len:880 (+) Transcript_9745:241-2880(+)
MSQLLQFYKSFQQSKAPVSKPAPTFEDLTIDDTLSEQQRIVRYSKSTIGLQRLVHVKKMADVARSIGYAETAASLIPLIGPLSKDVEPVVKQHLVEQLRYIAKFCCEAGGEEGYRTVLEDILPVTATLLEDDKLEVRQSASLTLVEVAQLIKIDDIGQYVLTIILRLAHEDDREEMRMTASQLLNLLAEALGADLCKQFVIPEVVSLAEDPVFRVRKSTALNFHNICKVGGEHELLERLMPAFVRLSKDDMYRVRRACAESLSEISKNVSEDVRLGVLVEIFLRLTHDPSKLVKQSVLQQAGMFVATLPARAINENILNQYCSMISNPTGDANVDNDLKYICAFSFPAVFQVIGPKRWHEVREVYHILAQSRSTNIKQTLAHSLHEVARILAEGAVVEEELVPVFEEMVQDVEVVQMGVIKHLAKFLACLPEPCRVSYLPLLHDILHSTNPFNWRLRRYLAHQLPDLVLLPPKEDLFRTLFPTVMILLQDPVASVRLVTFHGVTALLLNLYQLIESEVQASGDSDLAISYQQNVEDVIAAINSFASGEKFQLRQLWLELCSQLLRDLPRDVFEHNFIEGILSLTCDTVTNVRIALSVFLTSYDIAPYSTGTGADAGTDTDKGAGADAEGKQSNWHWLLRRADIKACVERLSRDDRDVFLNLSKLAPLYPDVAFSEMSCRGRKTPPGGSTPITLDASPMTTRPLDVHAPPTLTITSEYADNSEDISICISADASVDTISSPQGSSKSRSGSFTVQPIEIDHILSRSPTGRHPELTAFSAEANTIVADEIDMLDGFVPYGPYRTQKGDFDNTPDYDEDRDVDEAAEIEAAAAAKAAIAAAENAEAAEDTVADLAASRGVSIDSNNSSDTRDSTDDVLPDSI